MSIRTRINRPTTATPRKDPPGRYLFVSTPVAHLSRRERNHGTVPNIATGRSFKKPQ